jgi:MFS family permease
LLAFLRVLDGIGVGGNIPVIWTYAAELAPPKNSGRLLSVMGVFFSLGSMLTSGISLVIFKNLDLSWRVFTVVCAIPNSFSLILVTLLMP